MMQRIKVLVTLVVLLLATSMQLSAQKKYRSYYSNNYVPRPVTMEEVIGNFQQYVEDKETGDIVHRAMSQLPYNWRKIIEMREYEKMSFAEIAEVLGTTESSCRGMMSKARSRLLQILGRIT